jgi:G:T/U-mismatch repair DNA glycosylase
MQKIKFLTQYNNYVVIAETHIFFDFNRRNLEYLKSLHSNTVNKIHIYLSGHQSVNETLKNLIQYYENKKEKRVKIIIHIYKSIRELKSFVIRYFKELNGYRIIIEKGRANKFIAHTSDGNGILSVIFNKDSYNIQIDKINNVGYIKIVFPSYPFNPADIEDDRGIFTTLEERVNPEQFRDKLIEKFKEQCPENILKSFKDDQDIWDYIMKQGEWKIVEK